MWADVQRWVKECDTCARHTNVRSKLGMLDPTTTAKLAGRRRVAMDILGPLPETSDGNRYVLVAVDYDDGWPDAQAIKSIETENVMKAFYDSVVATSGVPDDLITDHASNFTSEMAEAIFVDL